MKGRKSEEKKKKGIQDKLHCEATSVRCCYVLLWEQKYLHGTYSTYRVFQGLSKIVNLNSCEGK